MRLLRRSIPNANTLFVFEAVARHSSFQTAAGELNVTQPSVSFAIRKLETNLGYKLFDRFHRGIELTDNGQILYDDVVRVFDILEKSLDQLGKPKQEVVRIAVTTMFATQVLIPLLPEFEAEYPNVALDITTVAWPTEPDSKTDLSVQLKESNLDEPSLWVIAEEEIFPLCSKRYLEKAPVLTSPKDLVNHKLFHLKDQHVERTTWKEWVQLAGYPDLECPVFTTLNSYDVILQAILAGQGIALGWRHLSFNLVENGELVRPFRDSIKTGNTFYLLGRKEKRSRPIVEKVKNWLLIKTVMYRK